MSLPTSTPACADGPAKHPPGASPPADQGASVLTPQQWQVLASLPADRPVVMLNLLRFREQAAYDDPREACSGREAYRRYSEASLRTLAAIGAGVVFAGKTAAALIGPVGECWHQIFLVQYPSPQAFRDMLAMPQYQAAVRHRTAALEDSRLVPITPYPA